MNGKAMNQKGENFEPNPISLCTDNPDGKIYEKKKKKKWNKKKGKLAKKSDLPCDGDKKLPICSRDGFPDHTQNCSSVGIQNSNNCSKMSNHGSDELRNDSFLEDLQASQPSAVLQCSKVELEDSNGSVCEDNKTGSGRSCAHDGKENKFFVKKWQKRQRTARDQQRHWVKEQPSYRYPAVENSVWVEHGNSLEANALVFSGHNSGDYRRMPRRVLGEAPQWVASQQRLNCNGKKGLGNCRANFFGLHDKFVSYQKEFSQVPFGMHYYKNRDTAKRMFYNDHHVASHGYKLCLNSSFVYSKISTQSVINGSQPHKFMKIPIMEHNSGRCLYSPLDGRQYSEFGYHSDHKFRKDVTTGASSKKWKPVGTKESRPTEGICSAATCNASNLDLPVLSKGLGNIHPEESSIPSPSSDTFSETKGTNSISSHQLPSSYYEHPTFHKSTAEVEDQKIESNGYEANGIRPKDTIEFLIGSQMAVEALNASYRMQLASEVVHLTMGCPLAEFERFIHCAAPVIASSYEHKKCSVCLDDQLSHSFLCKHQIPNLSLRTVWNWYEKPGNYGLDVKADDSRNLNDSVSFHAHFAPSLSAVQLFRSNDPGSKTLNSTSSAEAAELNYLQAGTENFDSVKEPVGSFDWSPDCKLIFEFFESEQPHQRKPFYNKIVELIGVGTSNHHIFGDPSKLDCLNLHDLHPASWFSVAWYPIYRIPERNFRASFLTYHSLGHFAQRPFPTDASNEHTSRILSPVLGLQSYNARGEGWFDPKIPTASNSAEILKERLRTLEANAIRFGRGCVFKDKVMVFNRHPDYEFFNSRKTHYK
ncbi:PREDICTED: uncharacterized protein LOC103329493 [Prunus mume]|uniref:Uncharacterized protein LOC103329493 n=1 Tax=Prunus mume TaxID=102107 RepID=A0ABM0NUV7_PRUMU|nr:PREDICTED: uncharacterized protein LOC103329493 [Prunus mume]